MTFTRILFIRLDTVSCARSDVGVRLDIESLRTFRTLIESGSVTKAAAQLHMTQSAVSWKMKRLEERVGANLVTRRGRELELTELGVELLQHAELLVSAHDVAVDALTQSQLEGTIHLGMNDELKADDLAQVLARFKRRHPLVRLHIKMGRSESIAKEIRSGQLDLGLIQTLSPRKGDQVLWTEALQWYCGPQPEPNLDEPVPLVTFGVNSIYLPSMLAELKSAGLKHYIAFEAEGTAAVYNAILAGFGVGVLHERSNPVLLEEWSPPGLPGNLAEPSFVLRTSGRSRSVAVRALVDEILTTALM